MDIQNWQKDFKKNCQAYVDKTFPVLCSEPLPPIKKPFMLSSSVPEFGNPISSQLDGTNTKASFILIPSTNNPPRLALPFKTFPHSSQLVHFPSCTGLVKVLVI